MSKKEKELARLIDLVTIMQCNIDSVKMKCSELKLLCKLLGADEQASVDDSLKSLATKIEKVLDYFWVSAFQYQVIKLVRMQNFFICNFCLLNN